MNTILKDHRDKLFTPSRQWDKDFDEVDANVIFKKNILDYYSSKTLLTFRNKIRTRLCLYFYFKEYYIISSFIYSSLYDECCVAKEVFFAKTFLSEEDKAKIDSEIKTENIDLTTLKMGVQVVVSSSEHLTPCIIGSTFCSENPSESTTGPSGPNGITG